MKRPVAWFVPCLSVFLLSLLSGCFGGLNVNALPETQAAARRLAPGERSPLWTLPTDARAADLIEFLDEDRVLVGEIDGGGLYSSPSLGPIRLIEAGTGRVLWTATRDSSPDTTHVVLAMTPGALILAGAGKDAGEVRALEAATGRRLWGRTTGAEAAGRMSRDGRRFFILSSGRLEAVDPGTGASLWTSEAPAGGRDVALTDGPVLVAGGSVRAFDAESGRRLWDAALPELGDEPRALLAAAGGAVAWTSRGAALIGLADGRPRWVRPSAGAGTRGLTCIGDAVFRIDGSADVLGTDHVERLDLPDGRARWRVDTRGLVVSPLSGSGTLVFFTIEDALVGLNAGDGSEAFRQVFGDAFAKENPVSVSPGGVPDELAFFDDLVVVDREGMGLQAYRLPSGSMAWTAPAFAGKRTVNTLYRELLGGMKVDVASAGPSLRLADWSEPRPSAAALRAQQRYDETMAQTARVLGDPNASAGDRRSAIETRQMSARLEGARLQTSQAMDRMVTTSQAALAAAGAIVAIGQAIQRARDEQVMSALVVRARMGLRGAIRARGTAVRGEVYVCGFGDSQGSGVRLVHLKSGRVEELRYEPVDPLHRICAVRTEVYGLSPSGKRLVVVGLGLDADRYQPASSGGLTGAKASILCFDPTQPRPPAVAAPKAPAESVPPCPLAEAIGRGDVEGVRARLDAGDNSNLVMVIDMGPPIGMSTPLRMAAVGHPEIVRLLLERGAKTAFDEGIPGPTAMDAASEALDAQYPALAKGRAEVRSILKAAGARTRAMIQPSSDATASGGHLYLLRGVVNDPRGDGAWKRSPVIRDALESGNGRLALALADRGADVNAAEANGNTALGFAVMKADPAMTGELLKRGADPNRANKAGWTPLMSLFGPYGPSYVDPKREPIKEVVRLLLRHGADTGGRLPATAASPSMTVLEAARARSSELADLLEKRGAK
jgi:outer membrane protein assembly factor BamB